VGEARVDVVTGPRTPDPRRWATLGIVVMAVLIIVLDNSVLNVSLPTIQRELGTDLPTLQWVVTGYSLTFATLLIIGGRLGDVYGARRMFIVGSALFGIGSLVASEATSVGILLGGEAVIEGIGASLMLPATLAILANTFEGSERATAFAVWGAVAGAATAFGPLLGGFLTTDYSWRWSFRINVIVAPLAMIGALVFMRPATSTDRRPRIDVPGALLVAAGMFLVVFALSEGGVYGWFRPLQTLSFGSWEAWPADRSVSLIPLLAIAGAVLLGAFVLLERAKERAGRDPLFEISQLRHRSFRYGLLTAAVLAMGQLGLLFVLPVLLQDGQHLSAIESGLWVVPAGISIAIGAQAAGRLSRVMNITFVVRIGLALEAAGLLAVTLVVAPDVTFLRLLPGLICFGLGLGLATAQLTNVILSEIAKEDAGSASGATATTRQLGAALGIAVIGSVLSAQMVRHATGAIRGTVETSDVKDRALAQLHVAGVGFTPPEGIPADAAATLRHIAETAVAAGVRPALLFAAVVVGIGTLLSFLIPPVTVEGTSPERVVQRLEAFEPIDVDPAIVD
jgi:EmrB/QacA subfamily drug resistance transporter